MVWRKTLALKFVSENRNIILYVIVVENLKFGICNKIIMIDLEDGKLTKTACNMQCQTSYDSKVITMKCMYDLVY